MNAPVTTGRGPDNLPLCYSLQPDGRGGMVKPCMLLDPSGLAAEWRRAWKEENAEKEALALQVKACGWQPIADAPKDSTPVDLWRGTAKERVTDMKRVDLGKGNVFYEPILSGPCCVRDATHFKLVPAPPTVG